MDNPSEGETQPSFVSDAKGSELETQPLEVEPESGGQTPRNTRNLRSWLLVAGFGILTLLIIAGMSAYGGYKSGMEDRIDASTTQMVQGLQAQYDMGVEDMQAGRYDRAITRFQWIIQQNPDYPGALDHLAESILAISITASPTVAPTPTLTPTPDLRSVEELYTQGQQALASGEWSNAIDTLLKLRKKAPDMHPIEVDGMLYVALRGRGVDKIKNADLEGGTYDLAQAERFGPLDSEATNYRQWAEIYITGASFWELDWEKAVSYFSELAITAPYLRDMSGWTSLDRYREALVHYGDWLSMQERWCEAQEQYQKALDMSANPEVEPTATYSSEQCSNPEAEEVPPESTVETPIIETPVEVPTETPPPPADTAVPSETPATPYP
ncbi:MAG: hypothetical protein EHM70_19395 [Chloroflexota bacterium]|nr:MAG: hypothetical protein EHM70_19395 [Chloroflexota bacterium]